MNEYEDDFCIEISEVMKGYLARDLKDMQDEDMIRYMKDIGE